MFQTQYIYLIYAKYTPNFILFRFGVKYDPIHQINQCEDLIFSINVDNLRHKVGHKDTSGHKYRNS